MPHDQPLGPLAGEQEPKPGFFGGVLSALFPTSGYGDMIDPNQLRQEQNLALRRAGLSLLAGAGPRPRGTRNIGGDIAAALDPSGWQNRMAQVAQQSATIGAMQRKAQAEAKAAEIGARPEFQPKPGESDKDRDTRLGALADAYQAAGLVEYAKEVADLRSTVRAPGLTERNGQLIDHWGNVVGLAPGAEVGVDGAQLYSTAVGRLRQFDDTHRAVLVLNRARSAAPIAGAKLDPVTSGALVSAAQSILQTHSTLAQDEGNPLKALANARSAGDLGKFLAALLSGGGGSLSVAQRDQILRLVDPVLSDINAEQTRVKDDILRTLRSRFAKDPTAADRLFEQLPMYPAIMPGARIAEPDVNPNRIRQMNSDLGRPNN